MIKYECVLIIEKLQNGNSKQKLHIVRNNGRWYNGIVKDYSDDNFLYFQEDELGIIPILFKQIIDITLYKEKRNSK